MAEEKVTQATDQDGATPKPEAPRLPSSDQRRAPMTDEQWLAERRKQRRAVRDAVVTTKEATEEPKPEAEVPESAEEPTTETSREEPAEGSESADAQTETEAEASDAETSEDGYFPETLTEFAEAVGVDPKDFMQGVTATVRVNGESQSVPITDLLEAYSSKSERDRLGTALAEEKKAIEAASQKHETEFQDRIKQADSFLHALQASIQLGPSDKDLSDMLTAGQIDERGYIAARAERDSKIAAFNQAVEERNNFVAKQFDERQEKVASYRQAQQDGLLNWKPELQDPGKMSAFENRLRAGLSDNYGLSKEQVAHFFGNYSLHEVKIVDDALAYRELKSKEAPIKQRLKELPKLQKPGPKRTERQHANDKVLGARSRLISSQSDKAGADLLKARRLARGTRTHGRSQ